MNFDPSRSFAIEKLNNFIEKNLIEYSKLRNFDYGPNQRANISCLSPYVSHGIISEKEIINKCLKKYSFTKNEKFRHVANVKDFEMTTSRDQVDLTSVGDEFKSQYEAGLISGQGSMDCIWEHKTDPCTEGDSMPEFPVYLSQLAVRIQQGSDFDARFYIYHEPSASQNSVWYETTCLINNVAVNVPAAGVIEAKVDFITSGQILLKTGMPDAYLLQQNTDRILQEDGTPILLEDPTS